MDSIIELYLYTTKVSGLVRVCFSRNYIIVLSLNSKPPYKTKKKIPKTKVLKRKTSSYLSPIKLFTMRN